MRSIASARRRRPGRASGAASRVLRVVLGVIVLLTVTAVAHAQSGWALWEHPIDLNGQPRGAWRLRAVFEAERWCRAAMTTAINKALTPKRRQDSGIRRPIIEYRCLPEAAGPPGAKTP